MNINDPATSGSTLKKWHVKKLGENFGVPIASFRLKVEQNVKNGGCSLVGEIDRLRSSFITKPTSAEIDPDFATRKFEKSTNRIKYGVAYDVFFIPILAKSISVDDCIKYLKEEGYLLVGPMLLPLVRQRRETPKEVWLTSLDVEKNCYVRDGGSVFPCMKTEDDGYFQVQLAIYRADINQNYVLVCAKLVEETK